MSSFPDLDFEMKSKILESYMDTEFTGIDWERILNALPIPAAVFDRDGQLVYANEGLPHDLYPMLGNDGRLLVGTVFGKHHVEVIQSRNAVLFADERYLWAMIPIRDRHEHLREVLLTGFDASAGSGIADGRYAAMARVTGSMKAQLAAIAGLAGSLQNTTTGEGRTQAQLIELNSRLVLRELKTLTTSEGEIHV